MIKQNLLSNSLKLLWDDLHNKFFFEYSKTSEFLAPVHIGDNLLAIFLSPMAHNNKFWLGQYICVGAGDILVKLNAQAGVFRRNYVAVLPN